MCDSIIPEPSTSAKECARSLLMSLSYLIDAAQHGGAASELHLGSLLDDFIRLLYESGGFDDLLEEHRAQRARPMAPSRTTPPTQHGWE